MIRRGGPVTDTLGEQVYDTATVTRHAVHADGDGDVLLLRHGEPGVRHDDAGGQRRRW